jgi:thiol-disulfide isomerase/thioredoxin
MHSGECVRPAFFICREVNVMDENDDVVEQTRYIGYRLPPVRPATTDPVGGHKSHGESLALFFGFVICVMLLYGCTFHRAGAAEPSLTLLFFTQQSCPPCKASEPFVQEFARTHDVRRVEPTSNSAAYEQYKVTGTPCFVLLVDGKEIARESGMHDAASLKSLWAKVYAVKPATKQETEPSAPDFVNCPPVRQVVNGTILADIDAHLPAGHQYVDRDAITWGHETTHGIASRLRQEAQRPRFNAFYVTGNKAIYLSEPRVRLADVAARVPKEMRGDAFALYLTGRQLNDWNDCPLYILDEWTAYCNGACVGIERGGHPGYVFSCDIAHCLEFAGYANVLLATIDELDPNHPDKQRLANFIAWQTARSLKIAADAKPLPGGYANVQDQQRAVLGKTFNATAEVLCCGDCTWQRQRWFAPRLFSPPIIAAPGPSGQPQNGGIKVTTRPVEKSPPDNSQRVNLGPPATSIAPQVVQGQKGDKGDKGDSAQPVDLSPINEHLTVIDGHLQTIDGRLDKLSATPSPLVPIAPVPASNPPVVPPLVPPLPVSAATRLSHFVIVADESADYWPKMQTDAIAANGKHPIIVAPKERIPFPVDPLPVIVGYDLAGNAVSLNRSTPEVTSVLAKIQHGDY